MAIKFANNAKTTLSASISSSDTGITVASGSVFPSLAAGDYFYLTLEDTSLNREVVKVTSRTGNFLSVTRAQDGTTARAFTSGDKAEQRLNAGVLSEGLMATWDSTNTDINGLLPGSTFGSLIQASLTGHMVFGLRENDGSDAWYWLSGGGNYSTDSTYDTIAMVLSQTGALTLLASLTVGTTLNVTGLATLPTVYVSTALDIGHASDSTVTRKSAGILQVESKQLATVGGKVFRASQYVTGDGTTDDRSAYNTLQTTAAAASGSIVVDCLIRIASALTLTVPIVIEGGGFTVDSGQVLTFNASLTAPRTKIFHGSGTVTWNGQTSEVYPEWYGVQPTIVSGYSSSTNLAAVNAMHASITAGDYGAVIRWANKQYVFSGAWTRIECNSVIHQGAGGATLGTWFIFENTTGDDITFYNSQHGRIKDILFSPLSRKTSGYAVLMDRMYHSHIEDCSSVYGYDGFHIQDSTECSIINPEILYAHGTRGIKFDGTNTLVGASNLRSYRLVIDNPRTNNAWPALSDPTPAHVRGNWATSTAYTVGQIVVANGKVWQCSTAGTSASSGSGPSTIPGTTSSDAFTTALTDGTAAWKFCMQVALTWIVQDSYSYSLTIKRGAVLNGYYGFRMMDSANTGTSYPIWAYIDNVDTDHTYAIGIIADGGEGLYMSKGWQGSCLSSHGVHVTSGFRGEGVIHEARIYGNAANGILLEAPGFIITSNQIGDNSSSGSGSFHGIVVAAGLSDFIISNNRCGDLVGVTGNFQGYGVLINTGASDNYVVTNNICRGNVTGAVADGGTGVNKTVSGNLS